MWMEETQPFLSFVQGRNSTQCQYSGSMQCFYWRRQKKSMLGVQKSWLSGSSVSAIFLVKTLCPLQPIGMRMWLTDRPNLWVTCLFFCDHCINSNIDVCCVVQYLVNVTQRMSTMETCCPFVCLFFIFIPFWLHVDNWFPSWHWVKLFPQGKFHNSSTVRASETVSTAAIHRALSQNWVKFQFWVNYPF